MTTRPPRSATIADVARRAGVSVPTVSRVLNANPKVDPELAERVRAAIAELQYSASPLARSLALGKTHTVSVIIPDLRNPTFHEILRGISRAAIEDGYHVLIADSAEVVEEERALAEQTRRRTDGVILCAPRLEAAALAEVLPALQPVVLINRETHSGVPAVSADYRQSLGELLQHLYDLGHRRLLYLAGVAGSVSNQNRLAALDDFRRLHADVHIGEAPCGVGFEDGAAVVDVVQAYDVTAVVAFNDLVAMGLLSALESRGIGVPQQLSVVGFDDIPFAAYTKPPLTTAAVPSFEMGQQAWRAMVALLNSKTKVPSVMTLPTLQVRGSTGPAAE